MPYIGTAAKLAHVTPKRSYFIRQAICKSERRRDRGDAGKKKKNQTRFGKEKRHGPDTSSSDDPSRLRSVKTTTLHHIAHGKTRARCEW